MLRKHGVSKATFFKWRSKYGGATVSDVKRLRERQLLLIADRQRAEQDAPHQREYEDRCQGGFFSPPWATSED